MIQINMLKKKEMGGFTLIEGFPGLGLVGPMAISYVVDKLGMEYVGYVESSDFPPLVSIHKGVPMHPIRVYASDKYKLVTIFAEFAIPIELVFELSNAVYGFVKENGITSIFSIGGIPKPDQQDVVFALASTQEQLKGAEKAGLKPIEEGVATGVSAILLQDAAQDKFPDTSIMVAITQDIIDPKYAELAVNSLNNLLHLNIDTSDLEKEAKLVESKIRELIKKHTETHDEYKRAIDGSGPSMYA